MQNIDFNEPDLHLVKALKEIKWPIITKDGRIIFLNKKRNSIDYTINHISEKRHFNKVRDIKLLPIILNNPFMIIPLDNRKRKIYYGKRKGNEGNDNKPFLKIVADVYGNKEYIVTIYPVYSTKEKYSPQDK